jgi:hypothetical protein
MSVVIPLFDGAAHIGETLDSLLRQTRPVHEVVVVDDGSTDGGPEIVRAHPLDVKLIRQRNLGAAIARNAGVVAASGSHVAFLDQDDLWLASRHERLLRWFGENCADALVVTTCFGFALESDVPALRALNEGLHHQARIIPTGTPPLGSLPHEDGSGTPPTLRALDRRELLSGPPSLTAGYVVPRVLWLSAGGCFSLARSVDDYVGVLAFSRIAPVVFVDEPSLAYRVHPSSATMTTRWERTLLTCLAAVRHGDALIDATDARNEREVGALLDERRFWMHQLLGLASNGTLRGLFDALACTQILGAGPRDSATTGYRLIRRHVKSRISAASRLGS